MPDGNCQSQAGRGRTAIKKMLQTVGLMLLIAILSLVAVGFAFTNTFPHADADPNDILARTLMRHLKNGQTFRLAEAYPDPWDTVQVVREGESLNDWTWRTLRAFDANLANTGEGEQLLVFWRQGEVARMVRFRRETGMPWFVIAGSTEDGYIVPRESAVFRATLVRDGATDYYACVQESAEVAL